MPTTRTLTFLLSLFAFELAVVEVAGKDPASKPEATDPVGISVPNGFSVELLYSVPVETQGSWVSLTTDPKGRLIVCDQLGHLFRVTPSPLGTSDVESVERIDVKLGSAQGLLYAFDALYVVVNQSSEYASGLYRVRDTDNDDQFDSVELLQTLKGSGEHGPHGIVLAPNGKSLYVVAGNNTDLPDTINTFLLPKTWREDLLLPRNPAPTGHNTGRLAPGGWVCRVSPDGKQWDLLSAGFRNPYDVAFNQTGELFTFDADMEHDVGAPWYRPTRVCHVVSGAEFGWRYGTGKWPSYYPDSVPPVLDVGLGSPTGVAFGYGSQFPAKYRDALYVCDWTHGRLFAVHLRPQGASYSAEMEEFLSGTPLPLTDIVVNPIDQAMYFTIGGRKTQSGLYRVTWQGESAESADFTNLLAWPMYELRTQLESYHIPTEEAPLDFIWKHLGYKDRAVRYAARIALEHQPTDLWQTRVLAESDAPTQITALLAAARTDCLSTADIVGAAIPLWQEELTARHRTDLLRALQVSFSRQGRPNADVVTHLQMTLEDSFPAAADELNYELCAMLVYLDSPQIVLKAIRRMQTAKTQEDLLNYAMSLRVAKLGWSEALRSEYLQLLVTADEKVLDGRYVGGGHLQTYLRQMRKDFASQMSEAERQHFDELLNPMIANASQVGSPTPRKFVRRWTVSELVPHLDEVSQGRSFKKGKALFEQAACLSCHRFNNRGGIFGPDLTAVAKRYSRQVLVREIVEPSVQVSDQFQMHNIVTDAGKVYSGRILDQSEDTWTVAVDPKHPSAVLEIAVDEIESALPSTVSMMPTSLLDTLTREDILDLLAYLESAGDPEHKAFAP